MNHPATYFDMESFHGLLLTCLFIATGKLFELLSSVPIMPFLQGASYFLGCVVALDTMFGSPLKSRLSAWYKSIKK